MKALETCQRTLSYISVCPADENTTKWKKWLYKVFPLIIFTTGLAELIGSVLFFLRFVSTDLKKCLTGLYEIAGLLGLTNSAIVTFYLRRNLLTMIESLEKIYRAISDRKRSQYFTQVNARTEWAWGLCKKCIIICGVNLSIIIPAISVLVLKIQRKPYEFDSVYHTFYYLLPWNRDTLSGYFFEICYHIVSAFSYLFALANELLLFLSVCWHHRAFYEIFRHTVRTLDSPDKQRSDQMMIFRELIQFHNLAKGWFLETAQFFSPYILVKMLTYTMVLASSVFQLDLQLQHLEFSLFTAIIATTISISNLLFYCLVAKLATESFKNMADCLYESNWHDLPIDLQKYLVVMIANAQIRLNYHGYGMIYLNLETFVKMLRAVFSYYMMFKTFTQ